MTIDMKSGSTRVVPVCTLAVALGMAFIAAGTSAASEEVVARGAEVIGPVEPVLTQRLNDIPSARSWRPGDAIREIPRRSYESADPLADKYSAAGLADPLTDLQDQRDAEHRTPTLMLGVNIDGQGYTGATPPDTVGDVGPDHYIQAVNASRIAIYDKMGAMLPGYPKDLSDLAPSGDSCNTNPWGDPIVLYDQLADRWFLQEFDGGTSNLCIYISETADPTGAYYFYKFSPRPDHDYPHYGVWPDAYYCTINRGSDVNALAFDRVAMLAGDPATAQYFTVPALSGYGFQALTPADHDGTDPPPPGAPGIFMRQNDDEAHIASPVPADDFLDMYAFDVDWTTPANSTLTTLTPITITDFNSWLVNYSTFASIPQPGTSQRLDPIREAILQRLVYRNFGSHEVLLGNFITNEDPATSGDTVDGATRWFELRRTGGDWSLFQEGTYGPGTAETHHFMGGIAMDRQGNIGLGYSKTDTAATVYPSIGVTGRLAADPPATMAGETDAVLGTQSQTGTMRYGDYAAMSIDPTDDCTFWYTNEYIAGSDWSTRITSFVFEECVYGFTLTPTPATLDVCAPVDPDPEYNIDVSGTAGWTGQVTLDDGGTNPAGTTSSFVPTAGDVDFTSSYVISNLGAAITGLHTVVITGTGDDPDTTVRTTQVSLNLAVANPGAPVLLSPADGAPGVGLKPTFVWTAATDATSYDLVVATDPAFVDVVYAVSGLTETSHTMSSSLTPSSNYYWKVTANNVCGVQESVAFNFGTVILTCETFTSSDVPVSIDDSTSPAISTLTVAVGGVVADVNVVNLVGTHTFMGDLDFNVQSPAGGSVMIMDRNCGTDEDFDINFDDEAAPGDWPCPPTDGGTYQPTEALAAFDGEDSSGVWSLVVNDNAGGDSGQLESWGLEICIESGAEFVLTSDPTQHSVCGGADAVSIISVAGLGADVTLSASSVPAGASVAFSQNPVSLPGSSTVTISNTQNVADGNYAISIDGNNGTSTESVPVGLEVFGAVPGVPVLSSPADGAVEVSPTPTFMWGATSGAATYTLTVASDAGFSTVVYEATGLTETIHIAAVQLEISTPYYWMVTAENPCGTEASGIFSFTTRAAPPVLLVDDDDNSPDVIAFYTDALTAVGLAYDLWDTENSDTNEPDATDLAPYEMVVWFTGDEFGGTAGPGSSTETALAAWLDAGGCFFISAQDYFYDKGLTTFMQNHLGVASVTNDEDQATVTGDGSVFTGMGPYSLNYPFSNYSDVVDPDGTAELAFLGDQGNAAVNKDSGAYRSTFWGFPFEALPSASDRQDAMTKIGLWCGVLFDEQPIFSDGFEGGNTDNWSLVQP